MRAQMFVLSVLAVAVLAGCSKAPPHGDLAVGDVALTLDGTIDLKYTAFNAGGNPTGVIPVAGSMTQCAQDPAPATPPGISKCTPASSVVHAHFMALPAPEASGYHIFFTGGTTATKQMDVGQVMPDARNMWDINKTYSENLEKHFTTIELRMGDFLVAMAPAAMSGSEKFAVPKDLGALEAKGTYKGKMLDVTVNGLPANGTFMARLYTQDTKSCLLTPQETFPIHNGANNFTSAKLNIGAYTEFHIHVGTSLINLYKAKVSANAPACTPAA